ncbi:transketolase family protein [Terasakiella sp. SH-1]|uniref:transketolase family protein n=1 Tax=Terasakiella sp. SH-1 TaxID=2560057 RepID=UPI001073CE90|nr:transketolase family protein [Terasakiella sp. SH-1]
MKFDKWTPRLPDPSKPKLKTSAMIASLGAEGLETVSAPFGHALNEVAAKNDKVVGMTADLGKYTDLHIFAQKNPDRYFQMGMAEQNLMMSAAGMAREGFQVWATTYAVFASRRAYDFICLAIAEEDLDVKIVCALPGLTTGYGPSHQASEDIAMFRGCPNLTIIDPCDATDVMQATHAIAEHRGPVYMRLPRGKVPNVLGEYDYEFKLGKAQVVRGGNDVLFISTGLMTMRTLDAAKELAKDNVDCAVLHVPTIKPLDTDTIIKEAQQSGRMVVVAENHTVNGGLGEAVARTLLENDLAPKFRHIGLPDEFLGAGALPTLHDQYGLSTDKVCQQVKGWLG